MDSQQPDSQPPRTRGRVLGARSDRDRKPGRRESADITHRPLLPVQDGGVRAAEQATPRARQGRRLAPRRPGVRVRRAVFLPNAAPPRPPQGSVRLGLGLGLGVRSSRRWIRAS